MKSWFLGKIEKALAVLLIHWTSRHHYESHVETFLVSSTECKRHLFQKFSAPVFQPEKMKNQGDFEVRTVNFR